MKYKYSPNEARPFSWEGIEGQAYWTKDDFANASAATFHVTGKHGKVQSSVSDRIYFVLSGHGEFIINDEIVPVSEKDVVIIPKNTPYDYQGTMDLFLVHTPAYDKSGEVKLE